VPAGREQIADVFERHVRRFGYAKTSVEAVAAELKISKKTIYEQFGSKRDLFAYVVERMAADSRRELAKAVEGLPTWGEKVEALMRMVIAGARQHIAETSHAEWYQEYELAGEAFMAATTTVMRDLIGGGIEAGEFTFPDSELANALLGKLVLEYILQVRNDPTLSADEAVAAGVRRFLG